MGRKQCGMNDADAFCGGRSLVYVEGEASMRKFTNSENQQQQALSIVQRKGLTLHPSSSICEGSTDSVIGQIDVLEKREPGSSSSSSESSGESSE